MLFTELMGVLIMSMADPEGAQRQRQNNSFSRRAVIKVKLTNNQVKLANRTTLCLEILDPPVSGGPAGDREIEMVWAMCVTN